MATTQTLRFRGPDKPKPPPKRSTRHDGILQDQIRRSDRAPWSPSFSLALRVLLLVRFAAAMYSNIDDCDEVYNFWEPLHFYDKGYGFQTWEVSPQYGIRSWAYILLHLLPVRIASFVFKNDKRPAFFALRISMSLASAATEAYLYRQVFDRVNNRVGRYLFFMLLGSAGLWNASSAFLPSTFAMYFTSLAFASSITPASSSNTMRTLKTTVLFAAGAILGWPFALAISIPFVIEELFVFGSDKVPAAERSGWMIARWKRFVGASVIAAALFIPVIGIDSLAYGKLTIAPLNIITYNIFSDRGPNLYGTEPWDFYLKNLLLNFNVLLPFALISLPSLAITYFVDRKRLGFFTPTAEQSSPFTLLGLRLLPFYVWLGILSLQEHKEERFMFPAYTLLCFNAAASVYLIRGWLETAFIKATNSPYQATRTSIFRNFTMSVVVVSTLLSLSRIRATWHNYHAPMTMMHSLEYSELPRLLNVTNLLPPVAAIPNGRNSGETREQMIDLGPIKDFDLTLCYGKEWYRFPGHYLVPAGIHVEFIQSEFKGLLPGHFIESANQSSSLWARPQTRYQPKTMNDQNKEEPSHYVPIESCDYLVDLDFPEHPVESALEPRYMTMTDTWEKVDCRPFLDARHSSIWGRTLWLPGETWSKLNSWGEYCLLRNKKSVEEKVKVMTKKD